MRELVAGDRRGAVLGDLIAGMPDVFRPDRAGSLKAVVHWHVTGPADGDDDVFELEIADGRCTVSPRPDRTPRLVLHLDAVNFVKMTTGNANARMLFLRGKLKARGDFGLINKFPALFEVPRP
ncbi:SCP2 sterol-binding domain-containing protein [Micromonospora sp. NPDC006766]|uniref:SCP2 sterol-binding domain-containing protein n=1 Tax=Micromonospora sp. NPDC006766 TaxID=3154778 RepID=UPI0033D7626D